MILKVLVDNGNKKRTILLDAKEKYLFIETIDLTEENKIKDAKEFVNTIEKKVKDYFKSDISVLINVTGKGKVAYVIATEDDTEECLITDGIIYLMNDKGETIEKIN